MKILLTVSLFILGIALLLIGANATESIPNAFSRLFTGQYTDRTVWLIVGGSVLSVIGLVGFIRLRQG